MTSVSPDLAFFSGRAAGRNEPTLSVRNLTTVFATRAGVFTAVDDVSFDVWPGECLGIVGESGSGKSVAALSILGLVDYPGGVARARSGSGARISGGCGPEALRALRGSRLAVVFQDPQPRSTRSSPSAGR
jgi:peptide/nickel transport system ATP-binding protein